MKLIVDVDDLELADLLLALEAYGLHVAAEDVPRVAALRNKIRGAAGLEPEPVQGQLTSKRLAWARLMNIPSQWGFSPPPP